MAALRALAADGLALLRNARRKALPAVALIAMGLAGCSGGGGGGGGSGGGGGASTASGPVAVSLQAGASQVANGASVTLTWNSISADSCVASGAWAGAKAPSGVETVGPLGADSTFKITCSNSSHSAEASAIVKVAFTAGQLKFERIVIENGLFPVTKVFGDLDGDNFKDVIVAGGLVLGEQIVWYRYEQATGSFTRHVLSDTGGDDNLVVIDMNGDNRKDIVAVSKTKVTWFENPGPANVTQRWVAHDVDPNVGGHDLVVADLNGDNHLDIVTRAEFGGGTVRVYLRDSADPIKWLAPVSFTQYPGLGLAVADIDGDLKPDLVLNGLWLRNPPVAADITNAAAWTQFEFAANRQANWPLAAVTIGDIDGDGRLDIVLSRPPLNPDGSGDTATTPITWFKKPADPLTNPAATWVEKPIVQPVENVVDAKLIDVNKDGKLDVVFGELYGGTLHRVGIVFGDGGTNWTLQILDHVGSHGMEVDNYNNDPFFDMLGSNVTAASPDGGALSLWRGIP